MDAKNMPLSTQNCNFCDRYELNLYREDEIMDSWDWSSYGKRENVFYIECKADYMLEKLNREIDDDDDKDGHSLELLESEVTSKVLTFSCLLKECKIRAQVICNMLGISEDYASAVDKKVSTFARSQLTDPQNIGCKIVPIVIWCTIVYVQHDDEDIDAARARVQLSSNLAFRQLPPIVPPPNPTTRGINPFAFQLVYRWTLKHGDDLPPMCSICRDEPEIGEMMGILSCWHSFHLHCIVKWLEINYRCPLCRKSFPKNSKY
ncbi:hypothetical protein FXO38_28211 [Capsicum annuum]|nr:hypothetical protein FXO38_28211 [Capsicum annuum]KAF3634884.1 hypothetical protein FXO37_26233 [Capsicum annuum]